MPAQKRRAPRRLAKKPAKKTVVKVVKGRVNLKVSGYAGTHTLGAAALLQFVPLNKIRAAAKKVLKSEGVKPIRKVARRRKASPRN